MKLKVGDKVLVIAGKDKGKHGTITKTMKTDNKVIVEKVNVIKKHVKPNGSDKTGGIISVESPIHASNVMMVDSKDKPTRKRLDTVKKEKKVAEKKVAKKTTKKSK